MLYYLPSYVQEIKPISEKLKNSLLDWAQNCKNKTERNLFQVLTKKWWMHHCTKAKRLCPCKPPLLSPCPFTASYTDFCSLKHFLSLCFRILSVPTTREFRCLSILFHLVSLPSKNCFAIWFSFILCGQSPSLYLLHSIMQLFIRSFTFALSPPAFNCYSFLNYLPFFKDCISTAFNLFLCFSWHLILSILKNGLQQHAAICSHFHSFQNLIHLNWTHIIHYLLLAG